MIEKENWRIAISLFDNLTNITMQKNGNKKGELITERAFSLRHIFRLYAN